MRFVNLEEHNATSFQKHLDLMSEKLVFVTNENDELRGDNDNHQKSTTMLLSKLNSFQQGLATVEDILGSCSEFQSFYDTERNVFSTSSSSSLSNDAVFKELPPKEEDEGMLPSVIKELSGKVSFQSKTNSRSDLKTPEAGPEDGDPVYVNVPSKHTKGKKSKAQSREILPDVCADVPQLTVDEMLSSSSSDVSHPQDVGGEDQIQSSDRSNRRSSDPNIPSLFSDSSNIVKKKAVRSVSLPKENENVELLVYRQISTESSLPSILEGSGNTSPAPPNSIGDWCDSSQTSAPHHDDMGNTGNCDHFQPRSVTFKLSVDVISADFGGSVPRTTQASIQQDGIAEVPEEEDIFSPQANPMYSLVSRQITTKASGDGPSPSGFRPRSNVISETSFDNYDPKISEAVRARSQSAGTRRRTPPLPPDPVDLGNGKYKSLLSVPSRTDATLSDSPDVGRRAASVGSPKIEVTGAPASNSADTVPSQAGKKSDSSSKSVSFSASVCNSASLQETGSNSVSSHASNSVSSHESSSNSVSLHAPSSNSVSSHSSSHRGLRSKPDRIFRWLNKQVRHQRANSPQP